MLKTKFRQLLNNRTNESTDYNKIKANKPPINQLYNLLPIEQEDFLKSRLAKGIIDTEVLQQIKDQNRNMKDVKQWFLYAMETQK